MIFWFCVVMCWNCCSVSVIVVWIGVVCILMKVCCWFMSGWLLLIWLVVCNCCCWLMVSWCWWLMVRFIIISN